MTPKPFYFDREKYLQILKTENSSAALTLLQNDLMSWEHEVFEDESSYQQKMWLELEEVRNFSRELWNLAIEKDWQNRIKDDQKDKD